MIKTNIEMIGRCSVLRILRTIAPEFCPNGLHNRHIQRYPLRHIYRGKGGGISVLISLQNAETFVASLKAQERELLKEALTKTDRLSDSEEEANARTTVPPTASQLRMAAIHTAIPFIGFGLLDNAIMITAGEYIDHSIGVALGISTMAAAALGNLVSDVCGIGLAHYVEAIVNRLGFTGGKLTTKQREMPRTRIATNLGRAIGISIGCILGMFPLLFYEGDGKDKQTEKQEMTN